MLSKISRKTFASVKKQKAKLACAAYTNFA
jgi:hypothetical protein